MKIDQLLYGYRDGHRLLAGSIELGDSLVWTLVRATDRPSVPEKELEKGIVFGFALNGQYYALCRTWTAKEIARPGAVWTHVLLLPTEIDSPLMCLPILHKAVTPVIDRFLEPVFFQLESKTNEPNTLSMEAAHLLMILAAKPRTGLRAHSLTPSIELLSNAQEHWYGILSGLPFATCAGKKDIVADKKAVVISSESTNEDGPFDRSYSYILDVQISSKRITQSWSILKRDPAVLQQWLFKIGKNFPQTTSNLKLAMESLLLGTGELDDNKLLMRIGNATDLGQGAPILQYSLGRRIGPFATPPSWISALFLMGEEDWEKWSSWVQADEVGNIAATAPTSALAERLVDLANGPDTDSALNALVEAISPSDFEALFEVSVDAAGVLVTLKPDLLYSLPKALQGRGRYEQNTTYSQVDRNLAFELDVYSWTPFFWKGLVASKIRHSYSESNLVEFVARRINDGTWEKQSAEIRDFLFKTPHFLDALLYSNPSIRSIQILLEEFEPFKVQKGIERTLKKKGARVDKIADGLVAFYGPEEELTTICDISEGFDPKFFASIAESRWRHTHSKRVLSRIKRDLAGRENSALIVDRIKDKDLLKALGSSFRKDRSRAPS